MMTSGASRMKSAVRALRPSSSSQKTRRGDAPGARSSPRSSSSLKTGTNARRERGVGDERADGVRDLERDGERVDRARWRRSRRAHTISRTSPRTRESPVASAKIAADHASRRPAVARPPRRASYSARPGRLLAGRGRSALLPSRARVRAFSRHGEHQAAEEAHPGRRAAAAREPALPLDDQDATKRLETASRTATRERGRDASTRARAR